MGHGHFYSSWCCVWDSLSGSKVNVDLSDPDRLYLGGVSYDHGLGYRYWAFLNERNFWSWREWYILTTHLNNYIAFTGCDVEELANERNLQMPGDSTSSCPNERCRKFICLARCMISRNERAVAEASSWLKRIVVTWLVLNTLGFIVAYLQPLIRGGQYTP